MNTENIHINPGRCTDPLTNEHLVKLEKICAFLETDTETGLESKRAKQLLKSHGYNVYSKPKHRRSSFGTRVLNGGKRSGDNWSKGDWNKVFNSHSNDLYTVIRDGVQQITKRCKLVPGDLCVLEGRQIVPADMRVIDYKSELIVDNRIITGNPSEMKTNSPTSTDYLMSQNLIFACTEILTGSCLALILRTGDQTVFGELTQFAQKVKLVKTQTLSSSRVSSGSNSSLETTSTISRHNSVSEYDSSYDSLSTSPPSPVGMATTINL